jgi:hypothetical protein
MHDYHTKKISLPSGQTIEIIYLIDSDQADTHPAPSHADGAPATAAPLHYCPECASDLVYPVTWQERGDGTWLLDRRCPNCEWRHTGTYAQDEIEPFDDAIEVGTEVLLTELRTWTYANMSDDVEALVAALEQDLIQPIDF